MASHRPKAISAPKPDGLNPRITPRQAATRAAGKLMRRLLVAFRVRMDEELRAQEVTAAQLRLLHEVKVQPGASGAQLARACTVTPQTTQAMLARAVERGWLERGKNETNHRLVTFRLTPAGEQMLGHGESVARVIEAQLWHGVRMEEVEVMNAALERALENLSRGEAESAH